MVIRVTRLQRRFDVRLFMPALAAGLLVAGLGASVGAAPGTKPKDDATCGNFGTSVHFEKSPNDAARRALKEEKLVMVLHISGHFEDPDFT
jgi:hypothetical protein